MPLRLSSSVVAKNVKANIFLLFGARKNIRLYNFAPKLLLGK